MKQVFEATRRLLLVGLAFVLVFTSVGTVLLNYQNSSAYGRPQYSGGVKYVSLDNKKKFRTYRKTTNLYDLKTLKVVGRYPAKSNIGVSHLAYKNGGFFYVPNKSMKNGRLRGVLINHVFQVVKGGKAVFGNHIVPMRNGMPLTQQRTKGGTCTGQRIWYKGLNNKLVIAIQKSQLQLNKRVPFNTAYRTYAEQQCLWNRNPNPKYVARPGTSRHNKGLAVDIDKAFANAHAHVLIGNGLMRPMSYEPWHFEPKGTR